MKFTVEEANLVSMYKIDTRKNLITDMDAALAYVDDIEMRQLMQQTIRKLGTMTDSDFACEDVHFTA